MARQCFDTFSRADDRSVTAVTTKLDVPSIPDLDFLVVGA
jgi:hypothetical protein